MCDHDHHGYLLMEAGAGEPLGYRRLLDHAWDLATTKRQEGRSVRLYAVRMTEVALLAFDSDPQGMTIGGAP